MTEDKLIAAKNALDEARMLYDAAHSEYESARRGETDARNRLNEAQKAFDAAVDEVKKNPPWNSEWHNSGNRGGCVA
jgi:hypothetical protein